MNDHDDLKITFSLPEMILVSVVTAIVIFLTTVGPMSDAGTERCLEVVDVYAESAPENDAAITRRIAKRIRETIK